MWVVTHFTLLSKTWDSFIFYVNRCFKFFTAPLSIQPLLVFMWSHQWDWNRELWFRLLMCWLISIVRTVCSATCRAVGEPVPLPSHGRPDPVHSHGDQLQHARLLRRSIDQHHGLVLQHCHTAIPAALWLLCLTLCLWSQFAERVLQKTPEWRHLQV